MSLTATSSPLRTGADYSRLRTANQRRRQFKRLLVGLAFVSPWLVGFGLFTAYPLLSSLYYSFTRYDLTTAPQFIGTKNYVDLILHDSTFRAAIIHTLYFTVASVVIGTLVALALARFLHSITSNIVAALRTVVFLPQHFASRSRHHPLAVGVEPVVRDCQQGAVSCWHHGPGLVRQPQLVRTFAGPAVRMAGWPVGSDLPRRPPKYPQRYL